jgi:hypothetical protein
LLVAATAAYESRRKEFWFWFVINTMNITFRSSSPATSPTTSTRRKELALLLLLLLLLLLVVGPLAVRLRSSVTEDDAHPVVVVVDFAV